MKKILIRLESYQLWGIETRIQLFYKELKKKYNVTLLSNRDLQYDIWITNIIINYFLPFWLLKDIFTFRKYDIIESNWLRDPFISILNYILFLPFYKYNKTKLIIVIHWVNWLKQLKWIKRILYKNILYIQLLIWYKIICVSKETQRFLYYFISKHNKISIIKNYVYFNNTSKNNNNKVIITSRLVDNKLIWIKKAIKFCNENKLYLDIYWWWAEKFKKRYSSKYITFYWEINFNNIDFKQYWIIMWMWRSILEWIAKWLTPVLLGYNDIITIIRENNYKTISKTNFSWRLIKKIKITKNDILEYSEKDYFLLLNKLKKEYSITNLLYDNIY
jgi:hypothetical protein